MVNLILASHGPIAEAMLESAAMLYGQNKNIHAICLYSEDGVEEFQKKLRESISEDEESILLVDIPGGTPSNQGMQLMETYPKLRVVAGMNLMMVLEAMIRIDTSELDGLLQLLLRTGKESVQEMKFTERGQDELDRMLE